MSKKVSFDKDHMLDDIHTGIAILAQAVRVTLGPKGRNVLLHREFGSPHVTKDGVSVAKEVGSDNPIRQMSMDLVKEAAEKTLELAGDGTSSTTVLTEAIFSAARRYLTKPDDSILYQLGNMFFPSRYPILIPGINAMDIKRGIDIASKIVIGKLKEKAIPIKSNKEIFNVAKISGNNDPVIGELISEAVEKVGHTGIIQTEDSLTNESSVKLVTGFQFDRGILNKNFATEGESLAEYENPQFFLAPNKISSVQEILRALEIVAQDQSPLVIIADDFDPQILDLLVTNRMQMGLKVIAIKSPGMGTQKFELLKDLAAITGCSTLDPQVGNDLSKLNKSHFGTAKKIKVTKSETVIIADDCYADLVESRLKLLNAEISECDIPNVKVKLETRSAQLSGKLAIISLGANTEAELKEKKDRLDDALQATKAAIQEGVIPGAGLTLLRISEELKHIKSSNKNIQFGINAIKEAIKVPSFAILENAGLDSNGINKSILKSNSFNYGYDSLKEEFADLYESGIIDPVKVTRLAVQNAASIAGLLITTGCVIHK